MHYADGTPAKVGDVVKGKGDGGATDVGVVCKLSPGSTSCNMEVRRWASILEDGGTRVVLPHHDAYGCTRTVSDFLKIAALLIAVSAAGLSGAAFAQEAKPDQVDTAEIARWGDRVVVAGEGPRAGADELYTAAMATPEDDSDQWYVTVYGSSRDAASLGVVQGFERDPALAPFTATPPGQKRAWAHFNFYRVDDVTQRFRFEQAKMHTVGPWPVITIQPPRSGNFGDPRVVVDRIEAREIGKPADLAKRIRASVALYCKKLQQTARLDRPGGHQQGGHQHSGHQQAAADVGGPASFPWGPDVPPPVTPISPQWPLGGPAAEQAPTLVELEAACPGAPADFLLAQLRARATVPAAQAAWQFLKSKVVEPLKPPATDPVIAPAAPVESGGMWLKILVALLGTQIGGQLLGQFVLPFLKGWQTKAASTPNPFDDLLAGFLRKVLEDRLKVDDPSASPPSAK